jgi:hypothetical protein
MADREWTAPVLEELSIPAGTYGGGNADDFTTDGAAIDDGTVS